MRKVKLRWFTIGYEELQAVSYAAAAKIVKRRKAFEEKQKGKVWYDKETNRTNKQKTF